MQFPSKRKISYCQGSGIFIKKGGFVDLSTLSEAGKAVASLIKAGKDVYDAATVGKKKTNPENQARYSQIPTLFLFDVEKET